MPDATIWEGRRALTDDPATSPETFRRAGRELLELDQLAEALELLGRAGDEEGLRLILERAVAEGHFFLYQAAAARLGDVWRPDLERLAAAAEKNGQLIYAAQARARLAGSD
ncbi:MAG: hypothetical protein LBC90_00325 [Candidatus Adiutrix sp.]|nr:hypothetical protein [Candidatus Adiutrix sp.]